MTLRLDLGRAVDVLVGVMVGVAVLIVVLDVGLFLGGGLGSPDLADLFDATSEDGLGSWLSVTQTVLIALTLWGLVAVVRQSGAARARVVGWTALALAVSYLAFDDGTQLHERIGTAFADSEAAAAGLGATFPSYYWQLVLGPAFAGLGLFMVVFLRREMTPPRWRLVLAALTLLALAVGLDFLDGLWAGHPLDVYGRLGEQPFVGAVAAAAFEMDGVGAVVHLSRALEESVEMMAMTLFWAAFLLHLGEIAGGVRVTWSPPHERPPARPRPAGRPARGRVGAQRADVA